MKNFYLVVVVIGLIGLAAIFTEAQQSVVGGGGSGGLATNTLVYNFNSGQFAVQSVTNVFWKSGAPLTNGLFRGTSTFASGLKLDTVTISNVLALTDGSTTNFNINASGGTLSFTGPGATYATIDPAAANWAFAVPIVVPNSLTVTGATPGTIKLTGTNGNSKAWSASQLALTYQVSGAGGVLNTNVIVDGSLSDCFMLLATNKIFLIPTNITVGQTVNIHIVQDGTGSRVMDLSPLVKTNASMALSTAASSKDVITMIAGPYGTNVFTTIQKAFQ